MFSTNRSLPRELLSLLLLFSVPRVSTALYGSTTAVCQAGFEWELNTNGQTPCAVAASLLSACQKSAYTLPGIPSGNYAYPGPTNTSSSLHGFNRCVCSMPIYSFLAACASCQGARFVSFSAHTQSCNSSFTGDSKGALIGLPSQANLAVRNGTVIPAWATFNWAKANDEGTFDLKAAREMAISNGSFPASDSAVVAAETATVPTAATTGSIRPVKATAADPQATVPDSSDLGATSSGGGGGSNAGAIAGGTVGGLAILSITGIAMYWLMLKTRDRQAPFPGGVGAVPGGGSAAQRVYSRDRNMSWNSSSPGNGQAAPYGTPHAHSHSHNTSYGQGTVGGLQRQASQWVKDASPSSAQALYPHVMSYTSAGAYSFPQAPSMAGPSDAESIDIALARARSNSLSQSQSGHAHSASASARPYIAVHTSGYPFPQQHSGGQSSQLSTYRSTSPRGGSPAAMAASAFRAIKGVIGSPGGLHVAGGGGPPVSPIGPRPMRQVPATQGVTIVNMDRPFVPTRTGSERSLPPIPPQAQTAAVAPPRRPLPEVQSATVERSGWYPSG